MFIDLTEQITQAQIGFGLAVIALLLMILVFRTVPTSKDPKKR